jgi:hypothetical protein
LRHAIAAHILAASPACPSVRGGATSAADRRAAGGRAASPGRADVRCSAELEVVDSGHQVAADDGEAQSEEPAFHQ